MMTVISQHDAGTSDSQLHQLSAHHVSLMKSGTDIILIEQLARHRWFYCMMSDYTPHDTAPLEGFTISHVFICFYHVHIM